MIGTINHVLHDKKKVAATVAALFFLATTTVYAAHTLDKFNAELNGNAEVPPVTTAMTGKAKFKVQNNNTVEFKLKVKDGVAVTAAHLHCASVGSNGPVVAYLFGDIPGGFDVDGTLAEFTLKDANIVSGAGCSPAISSISDLAQAMRDGNVYVNVHTALNPSGEIRGQLVEN